jgi:hypothetical protein
MRHVLRVVLGYGSTFGDPHRGLDGTRSRDQWRQTASYKEHQVLNGGRSRIGVPRYLDVAREVE